MFSSPDKNGSPSYFFSLSFSQLLFFFFSFFVRSEKRNCWIFFQNSSLLYVLKTRANCICFKFVIGFILYFDAYIKSKINGCRLLSRFFMKMAFLFVLTLKRNMEIKIGYTFLHLKNRYISF